MIADTKSLQQLMSKALEVEPSHRIRNQPSGGVGSNNNDRRPFKKREFCDKCKKWHPKDEKCPGHNNNFKGQRSDQKDRKPRVNEGEVPRIPEETPPASEGEEVNQGEFD